MKFTNIRFKAVALCLCAAMLLTYTAQPMQAAANDLGKLQNQARNINSRLADLEKERLAIQKNINEQKGVREQEQAIKANIDREIAITREEIGAIEELIDNLNEEIGIKELEISVKELEIDEKQAEHDANYELFKQRIRAMYMFGDASAIGLIFGAESFVDFLSRTDTITRVAEHDRELMRKLTNERIELEAQRTALDSQREDLESRKVAQEDLRGAAEEKRTELTRQTNEAAKKIQDILDLENEFKADLAKAQALQAAMEAELMDVLRQIEWSTNPYVGGELLWPVPGYTKITSPFGPRFGGRDNHTGIDISGTAIHGKPVVAANSGTVRVANWKYTPGRGYGIYVVIDHGGKVSTLYAHLSHISVAVDDVVARGQEIGKIGSTGWSTGPHLHFEYREDNKPINPMTKLTA